MKQIRIILLNIFTWLFWKDFCIGLKSVLGHNTLAESIREMNEIECAVRLENDLGCNDKITWENSKATDRALFAKFVTLKHFNEVGELLAFLEMSIKRKYWRSGKMAKKRIAAVRIKNVLKKLLSDELKEVERLIVLQSETLSVSAQCREEGKLTKELSIDFLMDYRNALANEINELSKQGEK